MEACPCHAHFLENTNNGFNTRTRETLETITIAAPQLSSLNDEAPGYSCTTAKPKGTKVALISLTITCVT